MTTIEVFDVKSRHYRIKMSNAKDSGVLDIYENVPSEDRSIYGHIQIIQVMASKDSDALIRILNANDPDVMIRGRHHNLSKLLG